MLLTRFSDYSLRVVMYLALKNSEELSTKKEISDFFDISTDHLRKVIHMLSQKKVIKTVRGKYGGFLLVKDPNEIKVGDLILDMGENLDLIDCDKLSCVFNTFCSLKTVLTKASLAFLNELNNHTIADLVKEKKFHNKSIKLFQ